MSEIPDQVPLMLNLRSILVRAEAALRDAADPGGAVNEYRASARELETLIFAMDQEARRVSLATSDGES